MLDAAGNAGVMGILFIILEMFCLPLWIIYINITD